MGKCNVCGYGYAEPTENMRFDDLSVCNASKDAFEKI